MSTAPDQISALNVQNDILNNISEIVLFLDKALRITGANNAALTELGLPLAAIRERPCYEVWHSRTAPCDSCKAHQAFLTGIPQASTVALSNGIHRQVRYIPLINNQKEVHSVIEIVQGTTLQEWRADIFSEQNRYNTARAEIWKAAADKTLSKEELIARLLDVLGHFFDVSRTSFFDVTDKGDSVECKAQWCKSGIDGYRSEKIPITLCKAIKEGIKTDVLWLTRDTIPQNAREPLIAYFDKYAIKSLLIAIFDSRRFSFFSFSDCFRVRDWNETETALILEMMKIVTIRSDQIKTEQEKSLLEAQFRHTQTLDAIGQLAGGVAHDFNNILGAISGYAEMIRQKFSGDNPKLDKYASAILSSARRAAELTGQLLAFARKGRYQRARLNCHDILSHISLLLQHTLEQKIKLVLDLKAENPNIIGDPTQLQNIFLSLAMNGRDAMPDGGTLTFRTANSVLDEILLKSHPEADPGPYVTISVSDTGVGMDDYTKMKLFEPFFTTKDIGKGVGLGLASVYGTVQSHFGHILVHSEISRGSTITVYLPVDKNSTIQQQGDTRSGIVNGSGAIVVIDNDEPIRIICREMLSAAGYTVTEFENGSNAIDYYRQNPEAVDLFIIDMIMDGLNGRECFRELKQINPGVRAILSSGYSFENEMQEILSEGIRGVLQKPFDSVKLSLVVAKALQDTAEGENPAP
jgi:two-component system cell cycle sensor histidine kinase/response regulator CckA